MTEELTEKDYEVLDACCELLSMKIEKLKAENERLKEILQEIKEIAKDNIIGCFSDKCDLADEILQKIIKAEEEWK